MVFGKGGGEGWWASRIGDVMEGCLSQTVLVFEQLNLCVKQQLHAKWLRSVKWKRTDIRRSHWMGTKCEL